jgi:hypothetical protein
VLMTVSAAGFSQIWLPTSNQDSNLDIDLWIVSFINGILVCECKKCTATQNNKVFYFHSAFNIHA